MSRRIEKPLKVGKTDSYSLTVSSTWLDGETITGVTVTTDTDYITVGATDITDNVLSVFLTGVASNSSVEVHFDYTTATRSDCDYVILKVEDC